MKYGFFLSPGQDVSFADITTDLRDPPFIERGEPVRLPSLKACLMLKNRESFSSRAVRRVDPRGSRSAPESSTQSLPQREESARPRRGSADRLRQPRRGTWIERGRAASRGLALVH